MDEQTFTKELSKYKTVRSSEYMGPRWSSDRSAVASAASKPAASKWKPAAHLGPGEESKKRHEFWVNLEGFFQDKGLSLEEARKLVSTAKMMHDTRAIPAADEAAT